MNEDQIDEDAFPRLPLGGLSETPMGQFFVKFAEVHGLSQDFVVTIGILAVSSACSGGLRTPSIADLSVGANLYGIQQVPSGVGKSIAYERIFRPLRSYETKLAHQQEETAAGKRAQTLMAERDLSNLLKFKNKGIENEKEVSRISAEIARLRQEMETPRLIVEDVTVEALEKALEIHGALSMISADGRAPIKNIVGRFRPGVSGEDVLIKAFSGDPIITDRISRSPVTATKQPTLSLCLAVQPDLFCRLYSSNNLNESGLFPRILPVCVEPASTRGRGYLDAGLSANYDSSVFSLASAYRRTRNNWPQHLVPSNRESTLALTEFGRWAKDEAGRECPIMGSCMRRWGEIAWRLALVIQAMWLGPNAHCHPLDPHCANLAIDQMKWFGEQQRRALEGATRERKTNLSLKIGFILREEGGKIEKRRLQRRLGITCQELESQIADLPEYAIVHGGPNLNGGRPKQFVVRQGAFGNDPGMP